MNISKPEISRELAKLMNIKYLTVDQQDEFLKKADKAKNMDEFKKDFSSESFFK